MSKYKADFLYPHDKNSIEEAGYEVINAKTEKYRKEWWIILVNRIKNDTINKIANLVENTSAGDLK